MGSLFTSTRKLTVYLSLMVYILLLFPFFTINAFAEDNTQRLLYQDATINPDGSVTVREAIWLEGSYNGATRRITFSDNYYPFFGIYSNFSGDTDIYNAGDLQPLRVWAVPQNTFTSVADIGNDADEFEKVSEAKKGKYGVYTFGYHNGFKIFCPSRYNKVICIEYTLRDAVVVHNDAAELYWCFLEEEQDELLLDYQLNVHLPQSDETMTCWFHGSSTACGTRVDGQTVRLTDSDVRPGEYETVRIMFSPSLVPEAEKRTGINGKDYILRYEAAVADPAGAAEEQARVSLGNRLCRSMENLREDAYYHSYNDVVSILEDERLDPEEKALFQSEAELYREAAFRNWQQEFETKYQYCERHISDFDNNGSDVRELERIIQYWDDEAVQAEYSERVDALKEQQRVFLIKRERTVDIILGSAAGIILLVLTGELVDRQIEKNRYHHRFHRGFPDDTKAYMIEYLMKKEISAHTFSVAVLELVQNGIVEMKKRPDDSGAVVLYRTGVNGDLTPVEKAVMLILFGKKMRTCVCGPKGKITSLKSEAITEFREEIENEAEQKKYFAEPHYVLMIVLGCVLMLLGIGMPILAFEAGSETQFLLAFCLSPLVIPPFVLSCRRIRRTRRTNEGSLEYSKWLAFRRCYKKYGNSDELGLSASEWHRLPAVAAALGIYDRGFKTPPDFAKTDFSKHDTIWPLTRREMRVHFKPIVRTIRRYYRSIERSSSGVSSGGYSGGSSGSSGGSGGGGGGWGRF